MDRLGGVDFLNIFDFKIIFFFLQNTEKLLLMEYWIIQ